MERFVPLSRMHWDHEPRTAAVSETSRSIVRSHSDSGTVHGELQHSKNVYCDHEPALSSPSPPLEERAGEEEGAVWCLVIGVFLGFGVWDWIFHARFMERP